MCARRWVHKNPLKCKAKTPSHPCPERGAPLQDLEEAAFPLMLSDKTGWVSTSRDRAIHVTKTPGVQEAQSAQAQGHFRLVQS